jgi:hypothetical protein
MVDLSESQKLEIATYRERLARLERGEVLGNHQGRPYTHAELATEIARTKSLIAALESGKSDCS